MEISAGSSAWSITSACKPLEAALIGCAGDETRDASDHAGHTFIEGLAHFDPDLATPRRLARVQPRQRRAKLIGRALSAGNEPTIPP